MKRDKLNPNAANLIAEALGADEHTERFLRQMIPSTDPRGLIADDDFENERLSHRI